MDYKATLHLPNTAFHMKGDLRQREPQLLAEWAEQDLYGQLTRAGAIPGDLIVVSGSVGGAARALEMLQLPRRLVKQLLRKLNQLVLNRWHSIVRVSVITVGSRRLQMQRVSRA